MSEKFTIGHSAFAAYPQHTAASPNDRLAELLQRASKHVMTQEERRLQKLSFVRGMTGATDEAIILAIPELAPCAACSTKDTENERLREALGQISRMSPMPDHKANTMTLVAAQRIARAALGDTP